MSNVCPNYDALAAYAVALLPRDRWDEIDAHLEHCSGCQANLETCGNVDITCLARLREPESSVEFFDEPECAEALARVAMIDSRPSPATVQLREQGKDPTADLAKIGPYRLSAKLGEGGMGTVYKAFHTRLERIVALKMLPADRIPDHQDIARFEREMKAVGKLVHPNIVMAHDAGEYDGKHFLVMEYVEGVDLSDLVRRQGPLPIAEVCEIVRQVAVGLQHAHEHHLVHRDIKPSNLMLATDGTVKILDLGLALLPEAGEAGRGLTAIGQAMGTRRYMAPEQGDDSHEVDIRADIYSLGATMYKLLTGINPPEGLHCPSPAGTSTTPTSQTPRTVRSLRPDLPLDLVAVVDRMLAGKPDDRFATPRQVAAALIPFTVGADLSALVQTVVGLTLQAEPHVPSPTRTGIATGSEPADQEVPQLASAASVEEPLGRGQNHFTYGVASLVLIALLTAFLIGFVLLKIRTPSGVIEIESSHPDVTVFVDSQQVAYVTDPNDNKKIRIEIPPGAKRMRISKDGFKADVPEFELRSIKGFVKVTFTPLPSLKQVSPADAVLQFVLRQGGEIEFYGSSERVHGDQLPPGRHHHDVDVLYFCGMEVPSTILSQLKTLSRLRGLDFSKSSLTDSDLKYVAGLKKLVWLHLNDTEVTDLAPLATLPKLELLGLSNTSIDDSAIEALGRHPTLKQLRLDHTQVSNAGVRHLLHLDGLTELKLRGTAIDDSAIDALCGLAKLEHLDVRDTKITAAGIKELSDRMPSCKVEGK